MTSKYIYCVLISFIYIVHGSDKMYSQQVKFGIAGGVLNGSGKVEGEDFLITTSNTRFYLGFYSNIPISEFISITPELDYSNYNSGSVYFFSLRLNYYLNEKFYIQAGPQLSHLTSHLSQNAKKTGIDISLGVGRDITDHFHLQARYAFELSNRLIDDPDTTARLGWLHVGIGYTF